jgi:DNA-binding NarL/FixJ family response regulator
MMLDPAISILLVDDHEILRAGLRELLSHEEGLEVVGEATNGRIALDRIRELNPDVVVMDLTMPELNGVDAARQAVALKPDLKVIGLSASTDQRATNGLLRAGAVGYVAKEAAYEELVAAIRTVMKGKVFLSSALLTRVSVLSDNGGAEEGAGSGLTSREREVLQLIAEGKATKEVAAILKVSIKTAETHRRNIMEKLGIDSVAELTKYAIREGLTST